MKNKNNGNSRGERYRIIFSLSSDINEVVI